MIKPVARRQAIKALLSLEHEAFGNDKGSGEAYQEWAEDLDLCPPWDPGVDIRQSQELAPPNYFEILMAVGISPQEILKASPGLNPLCFPPQMCRAYGFKPLCKRRKS